MNNLHFCEAQRDAFLAHLVPVWAGEGQVVRLIGANPLADSLAQAAQAQGVRLLRELPGADEVASGSQWIIFTEERGSAWPSSCLPVSACGTYRYWRPSRTIISVEDLCS